MNAFFLKTCLLSLSLTAATFAAESAPATTPTTPATSTPTPTAAPTKPVTEEMIRARLAEHIKTKTPAKQPATSLTAAPVNLAGTTHATPAPAASPTPTPPATPAEKDAKELAAAKTDPAALLPKVEVRRTRTTEIEKEVFQQERDIAREKLKTKSTDVDRALNDTGKSKVLSIFGGETSKQRQTVASERVSLMESERDIMEAIAYAKTKEEKDALRKELNEIKALRRDLETSLR